MPAKQRVIKSHLARLDKVRYEDIDDQVFMQPPISWPPIKQTRRQAKKLRSEFKGAFEEPTRTEVA